MLARPLIGVLVAAAMGHTALAGSWDEGWAAYEAGDYTEALRLWQTLAEQGFPAVQVNVATMYAEGRGVDQDLSIAAEWYRRAAEQGYAIAQFNLGVMYERGFGVPRDEAEAAKWYSLAAEQNNADAQHNLAYLYAGGRGVNKDIVLAYVWFTRAADQGDENAIRNRDRLEPLLSGDQLDFAQSLLADWQPRDGDDFGGQ